MNKKSSNCRLKFLLRYFKKPNYKRKCRNFLKKMKKNQLKSEEILKIWLKKMNKKNKLNNTNSAIWLKIMKVNNWKKKISKLQLLI